MMPAVRKLLLLDVVGLTPALLRHAPRLSALAKEGFSAPLRPVLPAVTCSAQSTMLTGFPPSGHGVVGNGWWFKDLGEVLFWRQSNRLVGGEKLWETARARRPGLTSANLFWWFAMGASTDLLVTPRPAYAADGRKLPDVYARPAALRDRLVGALGEFPLFRFWGPGADIASTRWIADAAVQVMREDDPDLLLAYLPHLDYALQRVGPDHPSIPAEVEAADREAGRLVELARERGRAVLVVSEYGITSVSGAAHPNRALREAGLLEVHANATGEHLDPLASRAFAVADHQVAHVYAADAAARSRAREVLAALPGVGAVLEGEERAAAGLDHPRAGDLVLLAKRDRWFTYYYWLDDAAAPDYARTVDIHRKPGYDPVELFLDPAKPMVKARVAGKVAARKMGFRNLLDVIPLDASLVKGSHGLLPARSEEGPLVIGSDPALAARSYEQAGVRDLALQAMGLDR
jgi:predicted AlkP superfamily pyrophosphatase or phosphodiesterase